MPPGGCIPRVSPPTPLRPRLAPSLASLSLCSARSVPRPFPCPAPVPLFLASRPLLPPLGRMLCPFHNRLRNKPTPPKEDRRAPPDDDDSSTKTWNGGPTAKWGCRPASLEAARPAGPDRLEPAVGGQQEHGRPHQRRRQVEVGRPPRARHVPIDDLVAEHLEHGQQHEDGRADEEDGAAAPRHHGEEGCRGDDSSDAGSRHDQRERGRRPQSRRPLPATVGTFGPVRRAMQAPDVRQQGPERRRGRRRRPVWRRPPTDQHFRPAPDVGGVERSTPRRRPDRPRGRRSI